MNNFTFLYKYVCRVLPEVEKLANRTSVMFGVNTGKSEDKLGLRCMSLFMLYPGIDYSNTISFITALYGLTSYLDELCRNADTRDEAAVRKLYPALKDAVDPERSANSCQPGYCMAAGNQVRMLVDRCRLGITALPSYKLVTGKMKKYTQLYIDIQAYRHMPAAIRQEYIGAWADGYLMRYRALSAWELSAAAGSLMGICCMFAAASDPQLSPRDVQAFDEAYFPWICSLQKLLDSYVTARDATSEEQMNFTSFYDNLRICEERLSFFASQAAALCSGLRNPEFHAFVLKSLLSFYLSDSRAFFGMYRLASTNIIKNSPAPTGLIWKACMLLRRVCVL